MGQLTIDSGDTAWMLVSTALVMLMILPGLALFYGGLVRAKNLLRVMSQVLGISAVAILTWVLWDYSLAFNGDGAVIGKLAKAGFGGLTDDVAVGGRERGQGDPRAGLRRLPDELRGDHRRAGDRRAGRARALLGDMLFARLWLTVVYAPLAHMVWSSDGLLFRFGAIDFAGGTVVHINSGVAGLVGVSFAGSRIGHLREAMPPHSLALTMVGAGLLWVGWFGFNAGSALEANGLAAVAMVNTLVAPAAGLLGWMGGGTAGVGQAVDARRRIGRGRGAGRGDARRRGPAGRSAQCCSARAASLVCYGFVGSLKNRLRLDDSLDVFGIHGLGGITGSIGTAIVALAGARRTGGADYALGWQLVRQLAAVGVAIAWSAAGSALCFAAVRAVIPLRHGRDGRRPGRGGRTHPRRSRAPRSAADGPERGRAPAHVRVSRARRDTGAPGGRRGGRPAARGRPDRPRRRRPAGGLPARVVAAPTSRCSRACRPRPRRPGGVGTAARPPGHRRGAQPRAADVAARAAAGILTVVLDPLASPA